MSIGVLLRAYSPRYEDAEVNVQAIKETVMCLFSIPFRKGGRRPFCARVDILVWADERYRDKDGNRLSDCGLTASMLRAVFMTELRVAVHEIKHGDLYCTILNYGAAKQYSYAMDYSLILSTEARSYINCETIWAMMDAMRAGALVSSLAINEMRDFVLGGCASNTFAMYQLEALIEVGLFDIRDAKPLSENDPHAGFIEVKEEDGRIVRMSDAGMDGVLPTLAMTWLYGRSVFAPILPQGSATTGKYELSSSNPQRRQWNDEKWRTKWERVRNQLGRSGHSLEDLKEAVMPAYRHW
jgi:hypothetical protein